jgi:hypothetical protein
VTPRKVDLELARLKQLGKVTKKTDDGDGQQYQGITTTDDGSTTTTFKRSTSGCNKTKLIDDGLTTSDGGTEEDSEEDDMERQQLVLMEQFDRQMEEKQQQLDNLQKQIQEHNNQHEQKIQQLKDEHQQQLFDYQSQLLQQEKLAHDTMTRYMGEYESSQLKVTQLTELVEKQDALIQLYMEQQQDHQLYQQHTPLKDQDGTTITILETDWHSLQMDKERLEAGIVALKANMETNQAHMQMMMMVSTEIQNDFEQQKVKMKKHMVLMAEELAAKDALLSHYQEQEQSRATNLHTSTSKRSIELHLPSSPTASSSSPSPILDDHLRLTMNNTPELPTPDISRYPSFVSSSSSSSSIASNSPPPPPLYLSTRSSITSVPPSSPPPSTPLPPIPPPQLPSSPTASTSTSSSSSVSSLKQQQHRYQQYQQQQQSRYFYQQQQKRQPAPITTPIHRHDAPIMDPLISPTLRASSLDELQHNGKPFWKNMKNKWRTS